MKFLKIKSYAKINLSLNIVGKLRSKKHKIESLVTFVNLCDLIYLRPIRLNRHKVYFRGKFAKGISNKNTISKLLQILDKKKLLKTYKGYVRKIDDGIITSCNNAAEVLWDRGIYKGSKPLLGNGIRYVYSNDYFNFFKRCYKNNMLKGLFYDEEKNSK